MVLKVFLFVLALFVVSLGRGSAQEARPAAQSATAQPAPGQPPQADELTQMRDDLNQLESLRNLMSSEIEFLHDQNLQILLRTNAQMWAVLTRDLRQLIARDDQRRRADQVQPQPTYPKNPDERDTRPAEKPAR